MFHKCAFEEYSKIVTFRFSINYTFFSDKSESGGILYSPSLDLHFFMHFCSGRCGSVTYVYAYSLQGLIISTTIHTFVH